MGQMSRDRRLAHRDGLKILRVARGAVADQNLILLSKTTTKVSMDGGKRDSKDAFLFLRGFLHFGRRCGGTQQQQGPHHGGTDQHHQLHDLMMLR
jgi:hypothetical protein